MGFWSKVTGTDAIAAAHNAVLMEHAFQGLKAEAFPSIGAALKRLLTRSMRNAPTHYVLERLNAASRPAQLNFLAFAMSELNWPPRMPGQKWFHLSNPLVSAADCPATWERIADARRMLQRRHPDAPAVQRAPFVFDAAFVPQAQHPAIHEASPEFPPVSVASAPPVQEQTFQELMLNIHGDYHEGDLTDNEASDLAFAYGLLEPVLRRGEPPRYEPVDLLDPSSAAHLFLTLLLVGDEWAALAALDGHELRVALLLQALTSSWRHAMQEGREASLSELVEDARERLAASGLAPSP